MDRREFIKNALAAGAVVAVGPTVLAACHGSGSYGRLLAPDANGLSLPAGFSSRVIATTGSTVSGTSYVWHSAPDGGATFPTGDGGWVYVSNSEVGSGGGGAGMVRFDSVGQILDARSILSGTNRNCAGGPTPWGTWLSCEEVSRGAVYECDPLGMTTAVRHDSLGWFNHEAAAVDPVGQAIYMTEDQSDGGLYRFRPDSYPDLSSGVLEVLAESGGVLSWSAVPNPNPSEAETSTRDQVGDMKVFNGGEGAWYFDGVIYFTTKGDNRVWSYDPAANDLGTLYDDNTSAHPVLTGVDNITAAANGDLYVAEDGGNMEVVLLKPDGTVGEFARINGVIGSEVTGPAFDPSGTRLYFSSQRFPGRTYEVSGPFDT